MLSGLGAEKGKHLLRACLISSGEREVAPWCGVSLPLAGGGGFGGKKCLRRVVFMGVRESAPRRVGSPGVCGEPRIVWLSRCSEGWFWPESLTNMNPLLV